MKIITIPLFILFTPFFYIFYVISAVLKSIINVLYIPFDSQRFANAYIAFASNAKIIFNGLFKRDHQVETIEDEDEEQAPKRNPVGFRVFKSSAPSLPSLPDLPGHPSLPQPGEIDEDEYYEGEEEYDE